MEKKKVCIIIPVRGEAENLTECLNSILDLDFESYEIIMVDDGLNSEALKILENFKDKVKILKSNFSGPSYARNLGVRHTEAEYVAFTDSDCIMDKYWLKELLRGLEKYPEAVACGGRQELPASATDFEKRVFLFMKRVGFITDYIRRTKEFRILEVDHNASCNVIYKREVFLKEGGFLEGLWPGEDVEFDYRLKKKGYRLVFNPQAVVYHHRPESLGSFLKMMYRYGKAQGFLVRRYGVFRKIQVLPFLGIILFFILILVIFLNSSWAKFFLIGLSLVFFYFLAIIKSVGIWGVLFWSLGFYRALWGRLPFQN